jgi:hypothetical protein
LPRGVLVNGIELPVGQGGPRLACDSIPYPIGVDGRRRTAIIPIIRRERSSAIAHGVPARHVKVVLGGGYEVRRMVSRHRDGRSRKIPGVASRRVLVRAIELPIRQRTSGLACNRVPHPSVRQRLGGATVVPALPGRKVPSRNGQVVLELKVGRVGRV